MLFTNYFHVVAEAVQHNVPGPAKVVFDIAALIGWVTAIAGALTTILGVFTALASFAWVMIRLYETETVKNWLKKRKEKRG